MKPKLFHKRDRDSENGHLCGVLANEECVGECCKNLWVNVTCEKCLAKKQPKCRESDDGGDYAE